MPIRPENRDKYPDDWKAISQRIRFERADGRCECRGECGQHHGSEGARCPAKHMEMGYRGRRGEWHSLDGMTLEVATLDEASGGFDLSLVQIVLTVAHLDHDPENNDYSNLLAMCQACHNRYDAPYRVAARRRRLEDAAGQKRLFKDENDE